MLLITKDFVAKNKDLTLTQEFAMVSFMPPVSVLM